MHKILVADSISEAGLEPLLTMENVEIIQKKTDDPDVVLDEVDALLVRSATTVTSELLEKMHSLKIIARAGVGVDNIDVEAATKKGIVVVNAPDGNTISTAEHTFAMMASLMRNIPQAHGSMKDYEWKRNAFVGKELYGKTLGIIGMGRIGSELAKRAKAFGMAVQVYDPFLTKERAVNLGVEACSLDDVLTRADIITVHTPLTAETKGLINEQALAKTKQGVFFLNCARGGIIDEQALAKYIGAGHVAGAALDVFETEPPGENPLLKFDNVIATPHLGASTKEAQLNVATQVAEEVRLFLEDKPVSNSINLPAISKELYEKIRPYHHLAKQIGTILSQCIKEGVQEISVTYSGSVADLETSFLTKALLSGFFRNRIDVNVNEVNALLAAKERGITVGEKISTHTYGYANSVTVTAKGDESQFTIRGTYIDHYGPRIVFLNDFNIDFLPEGNLLYIQHMDRPGVIGRVGKILGDHSINIATMQVGRKQAGGEAIMLLSFDRPLQEGMVDQLHELDDIVSINPILLS
ncbi:phosphoglycerate dehydrogenase [Bacillus canaveralius]|uniref:D-3-phosphoglycerate dehydrogenase n=1 Tax=Bacillus canaveralius TaxID=1403243 RepID=A0A2N5GRR6_9BACI|nr:MULTISPECIES: phosphoglycerate dehydrogenase [Bacillus]PLR84589.1 phosphoglycerate dehydrogenase [Bacillus sp. V33-4]PLR86103.1 phosphoglycerate dehydrogenase [Bacillus canaveralius]PLS00223.1 phosphoglycerate dehydrogenase [Bacillus canaveralius]RSK52013.1 phosphoglycerate dehydrogenase [Bacillus canaveralius]